MFKSHRILIIYLLACLVYLFYTIQSYAHGYSEQSGHMMGEHRSHHDYASELNLSKEQREKFNYIRDKTRHKTRSLKNRISDLSAMLDRLYAEERPDVEKISNVHNDIHAIERQIIELRIKSRNQKYDLLNKEQREKFKRGFKVDDCGYHHRGHMGMPHMMK